MISMGMTEDRDYFQSSAVGLFKAGFFDPN